MPTTTTTIYKHVFCTIIYGFCVLVCATRSKYDHWPSGACSSRGSQLCHVSLNKTSHEHDWQYHLHLGLDHGINKLVLALGNLNNLLNQASANPAFEIRDATTRQLSNPFSKKNSVYSDIRFNRVLRLGLKLDVAKDPLRCVVDVALHLLGVG